jgi:hypothetical protein
VNATRWALEQDLDIARPRRAARGHRAEEGVAHDAQASALDFNADVAAALAATSMVAWVRLQLLLYRYLHTLRAVASCHIVAAALRRN